MLHSKNRHPVYVLVAILILLSLIMAACGGGATPEPTQAPEPTQVPEQSAKAEEAAAGQDLLASLPPKLQELYVNTTDPINPSPFADFQPPAPPWKICYADSYQGNPWRVAVRDELIRLADEFKQAGLVESFENAVSNNDVAQNISNIRAYMDKGCDVILSIPESATGLNEVIKDAYDAGIPFVTMAGAVTSPYALNVNSNYWKWGYDMAQGIARELDGEGNVLMVEGLAGHPIVLAEGQGYDDAMSQYPGIKTVARVNGDWTLSVTKQAVLQALATHPDPIDAVWTTGSEARVIAEAFAEAGRPTPLITGSLTGDILGYWKEHGDEGFRFYGHGVLPHWTAQTGLRAAIRLLSGQNPKLNLLEIPLPEVKQEDLPLWYEDCMTSDSTSIFPIPPTDPFPEEEMNEYFWNGAPTPPYDYANVPGACGGLAQKEVPAAGGDLLASLPPELQALYENTTDSINPSPFDDFGPVEGPWKICYADSYQGNPWRVAVRDELIRLAEEFKAAGKVEGFENAVSNNDVAQQISNVRAYMDKGCDVILSIPESATGLNEVIKDAYDAGIPFVTMAGAVSSPYALNVNSNYWKWGYDMAQCIAEELGEKGNVLMVEGLAGHPIVLAEGQGYEDAMAQHPDLKTVARVNGDWTLSVTKQAVLQTLATHPEPIDAVWTTGSEARVIAEAFAEAGRPTPLITGSLTGDILGYWKEHGDEGFRFCGNGVLPHWTAQTGFRAAVRLLEGQQPKLNLLEIPLPEVRQEDLPKWYEDCMTPDATSIFPIPPEDPFPEDVMNEYFWKGAPTPPYDYANVPSACP